MNFFCSIKSQSNKEAISLCCDAIEKAGYTGKIKIGMDVAASEFHKEGKYDLDFKNPNSNPADWVSCQHYYGIISSK